MDQEPRPVKPGREAILHLLSHGKLSRTVLYQELRSKYGRPVSPNSIAVQNMARDGLIGLTWFCRDGDKEKMEWEAEITSEGRKALREYRFKNQRIKAYRWHKVKTGKLFTPRWWINFNDWTAYVEFCRGTWHFCIDAPHVRTEVGVVEMRKTSGWIVTELQTELGAKQEAIATLLKYAGQDGL